MTTVWLAWRDILARPCRTLLALAVVAACAAVVTYAELAESSRDAAVSGELDRVAAPLRVVGAAGAGGPALLRLSDVARVRAAGGDQVRDVEPWLAFEAEVGGIRARLVGAPPGSRIGAALSSDGVALGAALADRLGAVAGGQVVVAGRERRAEVRAPAGDADDAAAFVTLETAQELLGVPAAVSELRVRLWPKARPDEVQERLRAGVAGVAVARLDRGDVANGTMLSTVRTHHLGVVIATLLAAVLCLAVAAWLDAAERRLELAGLVALGATAGDVAASVAARSAIVAVLGGVAGAVVGTLAAAAVGEGSLIAVSAAGVITATAATAGALGVVASLPSAVLAARREPVADLQEAAS